jgi:hypothetical protein
MKNYSENIKTNLEGFYQTLKALRGNRQPSDKFQGLETTAKHKLDRIIAIAQKEAVENYIKEKENVFSLDQRNQYQFNLKQG